MSFRGKLIRLATFLLVLGAQILHAQSVPLNLALVPCKGEYALCYYAKCKLQ